MAARRTIKSDPAGTDTRLVDLLRVIASGDTALAVQMLDGSPALATQRAVSGASAHSAESCFLAEIMHYFYAGDTALHIAAASYDAELAEHLIGLGADSAARNRRGAEPLHYASDTNRGGAEAQAMTIRCLCAAGADPNARDKGAVTPLHRAVRTRGAAAVEALLVAGADPRSRNASGSTPLHLAVQNTGRGGTGAADAIERQGRIISLLLAHGALATDQDGRGKTVTEAASAEWMLSLLDAQPGRTGSPRPRRRS